MILTITADLTLAQVKQIASEKWYSENISEWGVIIPNPMNEKQFVKKIFKWLIANEIRDSLVAKIRRKKEEERISEEAVIDNAITPLITSDIA